MNSPTQHRVCYLCGWLQLSNLSPSHVKELGTFHRGGVICDYIRE
ncbi:hypothetical protein PP707_01835 [Acetobacter pasteurianus]|nr:hypothetical protein [Acetobacter pasteurianus]